MATNDTYQAMYCRLEDKSGDSFIKGDGNTLSVGAELELTPQLHVTHRGKEVPRVVLGRGNQAAGFVPDSAFKQLKRALEADWVCRAFVSAVAFDKVTDSYWSEVALIMYAPEQKEVFDPFVDALANRIAAGDHPAVNLSDKDLARVIETHGEWCETKNIQLPDLPKSQAWYKTRRTATERAASAAAGGKKGCYVGLAAAVVVVIAIVLAVLFLR